MILCRRSMSRFWAVAMLSLTAVAGAQEVAPPDEMDETRQNRRREVNEFGAHDRPWAYDILDPSAAAQCPTDDGVPAGLRASDEMIAGAVSGRMPTTPVLDAAAADLAAGFDAIAAERADIAAAWADLADARARQEALVRRSQEEIAVLMTLRDETLRLIGELERKEDENVVRIADLVSNMSAKDAARMLALDDLDLVLPVLLRLDDRQSADILARMDEALSREILTMMAAQGRPDPDARGSL